MMEVKWLRAGDDKSGCYELRRRVFVDEQGFADEFDNMDETCEHLLVTEYGKAIATARLYSKDGVYHVGRVCVDVPYRGTGIGRMVMSEAEKMVRAHGAEALELGAQMQVREFYSRLGYRAEGELFYEQGCPHIMMKKFLYAH